MSAATSNRVSKRALQACENCRRKKTRCPGEKPRCSSCARLRQQCHYSRSNIESYQEDDTRTRYLERRLAQLEQKMESVLERPQRSPTQGETPRSSEIESAMPKEISTPLIAVQTDSCASLLPELSLISKAIDVYFSCCHRQPLWLFDADQGLEPSSCCEELLFTIIALATLYATDDYFDGLLQGHETYADASRTLIMLRIANGSVAISTLQALCLLSYVNFVSNDVHVARLHASLAKNLLQCAGLDVMSSAERSPVLESQRRLCWSILALEQLFGMQPSIPFVGGDIHCPRYLDLPVLSQKASIPCQLFPLESYHDLDEKVVGVWSYMLQQMYVWRAVRSYVWTCANGHNKSPWQPDSEYTIINSCLLDLECALPSFVRFGTSKFVERSPEEVQAKKQFWLPWLGTQVLYHTTHSVLNHPFLYSQKRSQHRAGPNIFWKTSAEIAILHCTWIIRLINLGIEKKLTICDPFFAHGAAIAATIHLYYSRAADPQASSSALSNLEKCRSFITEMGKHWPVCRSMSETLDQLVGSAAWTTQPDKPEHNTSTSVAVNTSLMWKILDFAAPRGDTWRGKGIFQSTSLATSHSKVQHDQTTIHEPPTENAAAVVENSSRMVGSSPDWFNPIPATSSKPVEAVWEIAERRSTFPQDQNECALPDAIGNTELPELTNWYWTEDPSNETLMDIANDPMSQFYDRNSSNSAWWDFGDL